MFSASQVDTFLDCPRKWAFTYVDGHPRVQTDAAALGTLVHKEIELYLRDGRPFDLVTEAYGQIPGQIAQAGAHLLPEIGSGTTEGHFTIDIHGHQFQGYRDWYSPGFVKDWKTTKDFQWAKTADTLPSNVQAIIYATEDMIARGADTCENEWIYFRTRKPYKAQTVKIVIDRDIALPTLEKIRDAADLMQEIKDLGITALDVPPDASACEAYGGCPFRETCNLSPKEKLRSIMTQSTKAFADQIREKAARNKMGAPPPPPPSGGAPPPPPPPSDVEELQVSPAGKHGLIDNQWVEINEARRIHAERNAPPPPPPPPASNAAPPPPPGDASEKTLQEIFLEAAAWAAAKGL